MRGSQAIIVVSALLACAALRARAEVKTQTTQMTMPTLECSFTWYSDPSPRGWKKPTTVAMTPLTPALKDGHRLAGTTSDLTGYFEIRLDRTRRGEDQDASDWTDTAYVRVQKGKRLYTVPMNKNGDCATSGENALGDGLETDVFRITDDQSGAKAPAKKARYCLIVERESDGQRVGARLDCRQAHNPARDEERAAGARSNPNAPATAGGA